MATRALRLAHSTSGGLANFEYAGSSTAADNWTPGEEAITFVETDAPGKPTYAAPRIVPIMDLGGPELRLRTPLYVTIEESDGKVVALSYDLELAEQGETEFEALDSLRAATLELFISIKEMGVDAPAHLARKLSFLESLAL